MQNTITPSSAPSSQLSKPIIYQMLPRLWGGGHFSDVDDSTLAYLRELGVGWVWYTGVVRHASGRPFVKGDPGSPYAISDWYDVNPYLADDPSERMGEFEALIARTHHTGLRVIMDFVPNHVARDYGMARSRNDVPYLGDGDDTSVQWSPDNDFIYYPGTAFKLPVEGEWMEYPAKATGNNYSPTPGVNDWYDTIKINYGDSYNGTWEKMYQIVRWWAAKHVDGFRCDMVDLVPPAFLQWLISRVKSEFPNVIFIGETYRKEKYSHYISEVGFDWLYDKSGLYDALRAIMGGHSARVITYTWQELADKQSRMLNFLENHDEQRIASPFFAGKAENGYAALAVSALFNKAAFMIYFGQEVGEAALESQDGRTSIFDNVRPEGLAWLYSHIHGRGGLDPSRLNILSTYRDILRMASSKLASEGLTYDLCYCNQHSAGFDPDKHFAFLRSYGGHAMLMFCNFSDHTADADVLINEHASGMMGVPQGVVRVHADAYGYQLKDMPAV